MRRICSVLLFMAMIPLLLLATPLFRTIQVSGQTISFSDQDLSSILVRYDKESTKEECGVVIKLFLKSGNIHFLAKEVKLIFPQFFHLPRPDYDLQILKVRYVIDQSIQNFLNTAEETLNLNLLSF